MFALRKNKWHWPDELSTTKNFFGCHFLALSLTYFIIPILFSKKITFFLSNFISLSIERARKKLLWTWDVVTCCVLLNIYYRVLNHESVSKKRHLLYAFVIFSHLCVFYCLLFFWQMDPAWLFGLFLHILDDKSKWCRLQVRSPTVF